MAKTKAKSRHGKSPRPKSVPSQKVTLDGGVQKYNWPVEKQLFFESTYTEVKRYFEDKHKTFNSYIAKITTGWHKEKQAWLKDLAEKAVADFAANKEKRLKGMLDKLSTLTEREINMAMSSPYGIAKDDLKKLWEIARTENELPTRIIHSKNENLNFEAGKIRTGLLDRLKDKLKKNGRSKPTASRT